MGCEKCGAKSKKKATRYIKGTGNSLGQAADVQFRSKISTDTAEGQKTFYASQVVKLDFSTINTILEEDCNILRFMSRIRRIEFTMTYQDKGCVS